MPSLPPAKERALLLSSVLLTLMMLLCVGVVAYDANAIMGAEEIEEDTSRLLLNAEQWLNHQQQIEVAIRGYVLTGNRASLEVIEESRRDAVSHEAQMKEILEEYNPENAEARFTGLLAFTARHQRRIDEIVALEKAADLASARRKLIAVSADRFIEGAGSIIGQLTHDLQESRIQTNSGVSRSALRGSVSLGLMAVLIIAVIWTSYAMNRRAQQRNRELSAQLLQKATHDALTRLPNRDLFYDRLSQAISLARRQRDRLAVLYLDLDGFKAINDAHGHQIGDATLKEAARRLRASVRETDTVARLGGDEFAIVLNGIKAPGDASQVADKIIGNIVEPMPLYGGRTYRIGTSIGVALYPDCGVEIDRLVKAADNAMYASKVAGGTRCTFAPARPADGASGGGWISFVDEFQMGIAVIDEQHEALGMMLNKLNADLTMQQPLEQLVRQLDEFVAATAEHFASEGRLMDDHGYPEAATHKEEHQRLLGEVRYLRARFVEGGELLVLQWLKDWLMGHVAGSDRNLSRYLLDSGIR